MSKLSYENKFCQKILDRGFPMQENSNKLIILDYSIFLFRAIFAWRKNKDIPPTYTCLNMMLSALRKIGVSPFDQIILACDGQGKNWRQQYDIEYKKNRKAFRESFEDINWKEMFNNFNDLRDKLNAGTDWQVIQIDKIEADDIASVACRYFTDKEIILVSYDTDWEQLWAYENVKIFSLLKKYKGVKGSYKVKPENFNVYNVISKKIEKEVTDNLVNPILNAKDYENRKVIVSLIELPEFIENQIIEAFENFIDMEKEGDLDLVPYKILREKLGNLYNDTAKIINYEDAVKYEEKKAKRKKIKRR